MSGCPYCGGAPELVTGERIYPQYPELHEKRFWLCAPCAAYVGCHDGRDEPLGRLANRELRIAKMAVHSAFDSLWRPHGRRARRAAYRWLAEQMNIPAHECHIGHFSVERCQLAINVLRTRTFRYVATAKRAVSSAASEALSNSSNSAAINLVRAIHPEITPVETGSVMPVVEAGSRGSL